MHILSYGTFGDGFKFWSSPCHPLPFWGGRCFMQKMVLSCVSHWVGQSWSNRQSLINIYSNQHHSIAINLCSSLSHLVFSESKVERLSHSSQLGRKSFLNPIHSKERCCGFWSRSLMLISLACSVPHQPQPQPQRLLPGTGSLAWLWEAHSRQWRGAWSCPAPVATIKKICSDACNSGKLEKNKTSNKILVKL